MGHKKDKTSKEKHHIIKLVSDGKMQNLDRVLSETKLKLLVR